MSYFQTNSYKYNEEVNILNRMYRHFLLASRSNDMTGAFWIIGRRQHFALRCVEGDHWHEVRQEKFFGIPFKILMVDDYFEIVVPVSIKAEQQRYNYRE